MADGRHGNEIGFFFQVFSAPLPLLLARVVCLYRERGVQPAVVVVVAGVGGTARRGDRKREERVRGRGLLRAGVTGREAATALRRRRRERGG